MSRSAASPPPAPAGAPFLLEIGSEEIPARFIPAARRELAAFFGSPVAYIVISVFLSWHFVVAEYVGGVALILVMWLVVRLTRPEKLIDAVRDRVSNGSKSRRGGEEPSSPR